VRTILDHIILGAGDLDAGVDLLDQLTGVKAAFGGIHPGRGTRNALLALGSSCYLEIMAPDPQQSSLSWFTQLQSLREPKLIGWAVRTSKLDAVAYSAGKLGVGIGGPQLGSRARPAGGMLRWTLLRCLSDRTGLLPIFIDWGNSIHPARDAPAGCELESFGLQTPDAPELRHIFQVLSVDVELTSAEEPRMYARIKGPKGRVDLFS